MFTLRNLVIALFVACIALAAWYFLALSSNKSPKNCSNGAFSAQNVGCILKSDASDGLNAVQVFYRVKDIVKDQGEVFLMTDAPDGTALRFRLGLATQTGWILPACKVQNNSYQSSHECKTIESRDEIPFNKGDIVLIKTYQVGPPAGVDPYAQKCFSHTKDYYDKISQRKPFSTLSVSTDACSPIAGQVFYP